MLLERALDIFFNNEFNQFGEHRTEVEPAMLDASESYVDLDEDIPTFLLNQGLFVSRTYFYLRTNPSTNFLPDMDCTSMNNTKFCLVCIKTYAGDECSTCSHTKDKDLESDKNNKTTKSDISANTLSTSITTNSIKKRKICFVCSHTYTGDECIICSQNMAYNNSLGLDQQIVSHQQHSYSSSTLTSPPAIVTNGSKINLACEEESCSLDLNDLRQQRISTFCEQKSAPGTSSTSKSKVPLKDKLEILSDKFIASSDEVTVQVRRRYVFEDMVKKMKVFFSEKELCKVKAEFISFGNVEAAVDTGGPGRELFSLCHEQSCGVLLHGPQSRYTFLHDLSRLDSKDFYAYGQIVALGILLGYGGPHQFSKGLSMFLLSEYVTYFYIKRFVCC